MRYIRVLGFVFCAVMFCGVVAMAGDGVASERAVAGGGLRLYAGAGAKSFNYYLDNNSLTARIFGLMYESLLGSDPLTGEDVAGLASAWEISEDGATFTFHIDENARWSDGRAITAGDVVWTFEQVTAPGSLTGAYKLMLEPLEVPEALDERTVRFRAKETHWRNFGVAGGMPVLPRHAFEGTDFNKINFEFPVVSGPYRIGEHRENISLAMERRAQWWARDCAMNQGTYNFDTLEFRFFAMNENAFDAFRKGEIDLYPVYTARLWARETEGERFDKNWIVKQNIRNAKPVGFQGFAMNSRRAPYDDVRVRKALAHLLDRDKLNRTLMYRQYFLHKSYYEDLYDADHPCRNPEYDFSPEKAAALLDEAGWTLNPATGKREKGGKPLVLRFLIHGDGVAGHINVYRQDLKAAGIEMEIDRKDVAAWFKDMDEYNFEMTWSSWGSGIKKDPESLWASWEAERPSGNNITGYANARVDELITRQKTEFDLHRRHEMCREIDAILAEECPYVLLWNSDSTRLLYWNRFGMPDTVLSRFGNEDAAMAYWWFDAASDADLADAMQTRRSLPRRPAEIKR
ncbi:MAG: extracellular solute-binding protein [Kiritimatiellaeota bacterium]|nr:extracellular solute-binding protein [Kiritimatiellota bacterium]